jgi:hypothetical protein
MWPSFPFVSPESEMSLRALFGAYVIFAGAAVLGSALFGGSGAPASAADDKKPPTYTANVAPLLKDACSSCHSGVRAKARLDVTKYDSVMRFVKSGDPDKSKLHNCLIGKGAKMMPPKNPLAEDQIALIKDWIAAGAKKD